MTDRLLVVLRHAKSDWSGGEPGRLRPLAPRGRRQAPEAGRWLAAHLPDLDVALVSPATRTRQTWDLVAAELASPPETRVVANLYAASLDELLDVVAGVERGRTVLVAHNPGVEELVEELTGLAVEMKTSALAVVDLGTGALLAHGRPPTAVDLPSR
ncbi:MAG: histidine phosphatase family protein [Nocardioidaceae bacterium]|nr:histidine phosphatase family protein [Nocardioidaceae bacterium]NUS53099.1 histidine phosphatase family protein [Nocardioidaceae bacterium]